MKTIIILLPVVAVLLVKQNADAQSRAVGGGCEGCEIMYVGMPRRINATDTSAGWKGAGQKLLITGRVMKRDGRTPAPNVVLYYWHTDEIGYYSYRPGLAEGARRHGYLRGWVKTDAQGKYTIYTLRPAPYPGEAIPAHIHLVVKEPDLNEYYIDDWIFDDDKLLTTAERRKLENRGGSGVLRVLLDKNVQVAEDNIILGLNIPNYPTTGPTSSMQSGLEIGEDQPSFIPYHVWGPDNGTRTCPVCKYGRYQGIIYFVGKNSSANEIKQWLAFLEQESAKRSRYLKVYLVAEGDNRGTKRKELEKMGADLSVTRVALTLVPSFTDAASEVNLCRINPQAQNTFIIYRQRNITDKFINLAPGADSFKKVIDCLNRNKSEFDALPEPVHH